MEFPDLHFLFQLVLVLFGLDPILGADLDGDGTRIDLENESNLAYAPVTSGHHVLLDGKGLPIAD